MTIRYLTGLFFGIVIMVMSLPASAQTLELGLFGGGTYYLGDLNPAFHFNNTQLAYGGVARYNINSRWAVKAGYTRGKVKGDDSKNAIIQGNGLNFITTINDISAVAEFNFWEYFTGSKKSFFSPYIFGGVGFFLFTPRSQGGVALQPLGTEGQNVGFDGRSPYRLYGVSVPFGFGFKFSVTEHLGLAFEWGMRKTFTDYLDDVSTSFYLEGSTINPENGAQVLSDPTLSHNPYMQRGDKSHKDWFNYTGITLTYKINLRSRLKCNLEGW